jgi:H+/Cl- antiporter ClcA/predicted transcriptional regulator
MLSGLAAGLGLAGGVAAWALIHLIALITSLALFGRVAWQLPSFSTLEPGPQVVVAAALGGLLVSALAKWSPVIRGHGIPEAMEAVLTRQSRISPRAAVAKPLSAAVAIGTGGPFGAEGPIIVTGGAIGSMIGQIIPVSPSERKILLACGAAAGMAATFGAPLAAVVLAIELLLFEFTTRAFIPLVVASSVAAGVHSALFGAGPLFTVPAHDYAGLVKLPFFVILGVAGGLLAALVTKGLFVVEAGYRRLPIPEFWHPVLGGLAFGLIGLLVPRALGVGYDAIGDVLATRLAVSTVVVLGLAKLVAWWVALGSGTSGGTLAPLLLIGASFGSLFGIAASRLVPGLHLAPGAFAVVSMAAVFGAATRATFASIVFVFELTQDYQVILPLMLASVVADLVATSLMRESLMTEKLARRGLHVRAEYHVDVLASTRVADVMTRDVTTLPATLPIREAIARFQAGGHGAYPLVDETGRCVGVISRPDLLGMPTVDGQRAGDVASRDLVRVAPADPVVEALRLMVEQGVEHVLVMEGDDLVGICTRTDMLRARARLFEHERKEPGWMPSTLKWPAFTDRVRVGLGEDPGTRHGQHDEP